MNGKAEAEGHSQKVADLTLQDQEVELSCNDQHSLQPIAVFEGSRISNASQEPTCLDKNEQRDQENNEIGDDVIDLGATHQSFKVSNSNTEPASVPYQKERVRSLLLLLNYSI